MDKELKNILESAGFAEKEALVYLALLELGGGDVTNIAKLCGLKRSIIYVVLESLIKRGYVANVPNTKVNTYKAVDPDMILNDMEVATKNLADFLPVFRSLKNKSEGKSRPKIYYIENLEGIWKLYEEMSYEGNPYFITSYAKIEKYFPGAVAKWVNNFKRNIFKLKGRHLIPNSTGEIELGKKIKTANQEVRVLETLMDLDMDFTLYGNRLAITSFEDKPFAVVLESEKLVKSMTPIFEIAWGKGKEIDSDFDN